MDLGDTVTGSVGAGAAAAGGSAAPLAPTAALAGAQRTLCLTKNVHQTGKRRRSALALRFRLSADQVAEAMSLLLDGPRICPPRR